MHISKLHQPLYFSVSLIISGPTHLTFTTDAYAAEVIEIAHYLDHIKPPGEDNNHDYNSGCILCILISVILLIWNKIIKTDKVTQVISLNVVT